MKKLFSFILVLVLSLSFIGCGNETQSINQDYVKVVRDATAKLQSTYSNYIVSSVIESPDGVTKCIEVANDGNSYTEFSIDADGNYGTLDWGSKENITYVLTDWLTKDGKFYIFGSDEEGNEVIYSLPDNYKTYVEDRSALYVNKMLDNLKGIEKIEDFKVDLGSGEETFSSYRLTVSSECVKEILGVSSYGVYTSLIEDKGADSNIGKLCEYYLKDINMCLTFSDAYVTVGIDQNGILKYICLETGGLGTKMYYTKAVVTTTNNNIRELPDFSKAVDYVITMQDLADYISSFESVDEAINSINSSQSTESTTEKVDTTEAVE